MNTLLDNIDGLSSVYKLLLIVGLSVAVHLTVIGLRQLARYMLAKGHERRHQKLRSIGTLTTSAVVFTLYFIAIGFILRELGVSLTAYLASASVIGLAIGFGSQGVVQDVVTGLTFIFSDLVDVGDLVEISGQTGIVKAITMRFVVLENSLGAIVSIPNRTINNVINYPRGYVRCLVDVTLRGDESQRQVFEATATRLMDSMHQQFPGILIAEPSSEGRIQLPAGKEILRVKFRIWPNRGQQIETTYLQELVAELSKIDSDYKAWMIAISYEAEEKISAQNNNWLWTAKRG